MRPHCFEDDELLDPATLRRQVIRSAIHAELTELEQHRDVHRRARGVITKPWIGAGVFAVLALTAWWTILGVIGFTILAVHAMATTDWRAGRGRELDADIAAAKGRLQALVDGGAG